MKKNGFTLIELLAVIIILAIIALIATPIVLNVVEQARLKAAESSANGYISGVEAARYEYMFTNNMAEPTFADIKDKVAETLKGETVTCDDGTLTNGIFSGTVVTESGYTCTVANSKVSSCTK